MTLDIAALKAKLNHLNRNSDRSEALWKPTEGKTVVRIVPWKDNNENPFIELHFHYLGNRTYLSPTSYGNRDPIAEFAEELASEGTKDAYAQARPFRPKLRTFVPIIVRGEEEKGVRFMSFGKTVYQELLSIISDPDYGDITDVKTGRDVVVEYISQEKSDTNFAKTLVRPKPNRSPLAESADMIKKYLSEQPDIRSIYKEPTYEELKVALQRYLSGGSQSSTEAPEPKVELSPKSITASKSTEKSSVAVDKVVDEFDSVFN